VRDYQVRYHQRPLASPLSPVGLPICPCCDSKMKTGEFYSPFLRVNLGDPLLPVNRNPLGITAPESTRGVAF
jgi:hypothetical protein